MQIRCKSCDQRNCDGCNIMILAEMLQKGQLKTLMNHQHTIDPALFQQNKTPDIIDSTLLSVEEAEDLPGRLRKYSNWWWLRSPGDDQSNAAAVNIYGSVYYYRYNVHNDNYHVRPALKIKNLESSGLKVGDRFRFGGVEFEIISDNLAFCVTDIGRCAFRDNWEAADANAYENSDVRKFVDNWFEKAVIGQI